MFGPAIVQIVAVHRGDDHMFQAQLADRMGHLAGFKRVQRLRLAGRDIAKGAAARADLAHDHHGRVTLAPAFADIWAARLFADGHQLLRLQNIARLLVALGRGGLDADPKRFLRLLLIGAMCLLGVALIGQLEIAQRNFPLTTDVSKDNLSRGQRQPSGRCRGVRGPWSAIVG